MSSSLNVNGSEEQNHTSTAGDHIAVTSDLNESSIVETPLLDPTSNTNRNSVSSNSSKTSDSPDICRICHCEGTLDEPLLSPCYCLGTMQYLHQTCLQRWIKSSGIRSCELCKFEFIMHSEVKPFKQWRKLDMNGLERRKVMCSVAFNLIAVTCVLWSLHALIEKTRDEVKEGKFQWPFWTKLVVVAIGVTGGLVFLYVQCKMYFQLCIRWRQFNQRIIIHSRSEQINHENPTLSSSRMKSSRNSREHCIITVLDANDLPPFHSNSSSTVTPGDTMVESHSSSLNSIPNRRHDQRRYFPRLLCSFRSN